MKTNKGFAGVSLIIFLVILVAIGGVAYYSNKDKKAPSVFNSNKEVNLGEEFTLKNNQSAHVAGLDITIKLKSIVGGCSGPQCDFPFPEVTYELTTGGETYINKQDFTFNKLHYTIHIPTSQSGIFLVENAENECIRQTARLQDACWRHLAYRFTDKVYCTRIENQNLKSSCERGES